MAKILIVEDERSVRQALRFELEDDGYDVHYASDYPEALAAITAFRYDLIISDIFLGRGSGIQLMNMVKNIQRNTPFIIMTAFPEAEQAVKVKAVLKDRFFEKPFFTSALKQKIGELVKEGLTQSGTVSSPVLCH